MLNMYRCSDVDHRYCAAIRACMFDIHVGFSRRQAELPAVGHRDMNPQPSAERSKRTKGKAQLEAMPNSICVGKLS